MRLAVKAGFVRFIRKDNVAIVEKRPITVSTGCWLRVRRIGWRSHFLLRGGIRLFPADKMVEIDSKTYHIIAERKLKYGAIMVADKMITVTEMRFENPLILRTGYLVFDISGNEARLVDVEPTHVMIVLDHSIHFKRAEIIVKPDNITVFNGWVACRDRSIAMAAVIAPVNSLFTICCNGFRHYRCQEIQATVPPRVLREFYAETPSPS